LGPAALYVQPDGLAERYGCSWHGIKLLTEEGERPWEKTRAIELGGVEAHDFLFVQTIHIFGTDLVSCKGVEILNLQSRLQWMDAPLRCTETPLFYPWNLQGSWGERDGNLPDDKIMQ